MEMRAGEESKRGGKGVQERREGREEEGRERGSQTN